MDPVRNGVLVSAPLSGRLPTTSDRLAEEATQSSFLARPTRHRLAPPVGMTRASRFVVSALRFRGGPQRPACRADRRFPLPSGFRRSHRSRHPTMTVPRHRRRDRPAAIPPVAGALMVRCPVAARRHQLRRRRSRRAGPPDPAVTGSDSRVRQPGSTAGAGIRTPPRPPRLLRPLRPLRRPRPALATGDGQSNSPGALDVSRRGRRRVRPLEPRLRPNASSGPRTVDPP